MSQKLIDKIRRRRSTETGAVVHSWPGRYQIALIYPNTYHQGMSNLGFLSVYNLLNGGQDCLCERFFLPDKEDLVEHRRTGFPLVSLESQRTLKDFDLLALSVSFENDYLNVPIIFTLADIPLFRDSRTGSDPLVLLGGVCAFLNPEPMAEIADLVAIGEAEPILPSLIKLLTHSSSERADLLLELCRLPGIYVPSLYTVNYHADGTIAGIKATAPAPPRVKRQYLANLNDSASRSFIQAEETEFGDMALAEVSRGCSRGCRFCAAGYIYLPPRERSLENLLEQADTGLCHRRTIGLVGAAVADHSQFKVLQQQILSAGGQVSVSSLRLDSLTEKDVVGLRDSGLRTAAIAPEAGSQRLRDFINKGLDEEQIMHAVQLLAAGNIRNLKLYFLIGLPTEELHDLEELLLLVDKVCRVWREAGRSRGSLGSVTLSINPFIPKPFTPLQWTGMELDKVLKRKFRYLHAAIARRPNTVLISESIRSSVLQAFLSRGDRRCGRLLPRLAEGGNLRQTCNKAGLDLDDFVFRRRTEEEVFPWEVIDQGIQRGYLWQEYQRGLKGVITPRCAAGCTRCGVCG